MRVVVATYGSEGDTRPYVALGQALQGAGHDVLVCGERSGQPLAAAAGVPYAVLSGDLRAGLHEDPATAAAMAAGASPWRGLQAFHRIAEDNTDGWFDALTGLADGADLLVYSGLVSYVGRSVAEVRGIPSAGASTVPLTPTRAFPTPFAPPMPWLSGRLRWVTHHTGDRALWLPFARATNRVRRRHGLDRFVQHWADTRILYGISPTLVPRPADWPPEVHETGWWPLPAPADWSPDPALVDFLTRGPAPVYVGFGSMAGHDADAVLRPVLAGLRGSRVVLALGWSARDVLPRLRLDDTVHVIDAAPHAWLFPQMSALVHHCGSGTTHAAAASGIPSIPLPFVADQPFWADVLWRQGTASRPLSRTRLTASAVSAALAEVEQPHVRVRAAAVARTMRAEDGLSTAVTTLARR